MIVSNLEEENSIRKFVTCRSLISRFQERKENILIKNQNVKKVYNYANNKLKDKCKIAPIKRTDGSFMQSDDEKCNMFNTFFTSVFTTDDGLNPIPHFIFTPQPDVNLDFSPANISKIIYNMNKNSCVGPDGIPALFWNKLSFCLSYPHSTIFSTSFSTAILPDDWLTANVTPIFKNGDSSSVSNYCPISLTCIPCKILETIVRNYIIDSLLEQNVITSRQHGFLHGHSTCSQLLERVNIWASAFERNVPMHALYIDFKKALIVFHTKKK